MKVMQSSGFQCLPQNNHHILQLKTEIEPIPARCINSERDLVPLQILKFLAWKSGAELKTKWMLAQVAKVPIRGSVAEIW